MFSFFLPFSSAWSKTIVSGKITGTRGEQIPLAIVFIGVPDHLQPERRVKAGRNGAYEVAIETKGVKLLRFTGALHKDYTIAVYVDEPKTIHLDVRLQTYDYGGDFDGMKVLGSFNDWYPPSAVSLQKQLDGTYAADIRSEVKKITYRLIGVPGGGLAGTGADRFVYVQSQGYAAVAVPSRGIARIVFDPRRLVNPGELAGCAFGADDSVESRFTRVYDEVRLWNSAYASYLIKSVSDRRSGLKQEPFDFESILSNLERQMRSEPNNIVRAELHLAYFEVLMKGKMADSLSARALLQEVHPGSVVWSLSPGMISSALDVAQYDDRMRNDYVANMIHDNPSVETVVRVLSYEFLRSLYGGDKESALRSYDIVVNQYGETPGAEEVARYHNVSAVDIGKTAPLFSVSSMRDSSVVLTQKNFKGKYLLIDFWATWSKSSVDEMKYLAKAYREFGGNTFEILSMSLDSSRKAVDDSYSFKYVMKWVNAFVLGGVESKICRDYEVFAIPKPILIDPQGRIVAVGLELRGERLRKTLARFLDKRH